jgi:hypothetical protein
MRGPASFAYADNGLRCLPQSWRDLWHEQELAIKAERALPGAPPAAERARGS